LGLKIKNKLKNIICHSGMLIDSINSEDIINKDNFFTIIHGDMDEVIYVDKFNKTIELMEKFGISGNSFLIKDLGHSFSRESIEIVEKILNN
jgi:predicted esterase